ncbi:TonB-dependent receptor domain-containing protein [Mangrovimicrobium sediminis]|nr:TonB-dependent receptor [Haliea sp. SAOS-164]
MGLSAVAFAPQMAFAQEPEQVEEVIVTGSRIARPDLESASPVSVVTREEIKVTGLTDVGDLIQSMPSMSGSPIGTTTNNGGNGSVQIDLRGMGPNRTLTLINGQRLVDGGDYQTIPSAMIERVDILKDGASAVYGADAVAGVVNIITRKNFDGVEVELQTADWFDTKAGKQDTVSLVAGKTFDRGHVIFGGEFVTQEEAFQDDTPWDFFETSYYIYPEGCESNPARPYDGTPNGGCYPLGSSRIPEGRLGFASQGVYMNEGAGLVPYDGRTYNYSPVNYIQTPYDRTNFFVDGEFEVNDYVTAFTEVRVNLRKSAQELAPLPYDGRPGQDPAYTGTYVDADGVTQAFSGVSQDNYYLQQFATAAGLTPEPVTDIRRRMVETNRRFEQDITQVQAVMGLKGSFKEIDWELTYNRGRRSRTDNDYGQFAGTPLFNALGPSADLDGDGTPECYTDVNDPSTLIAGCVPLNLFGGANTVTQDQLDYVSTDLTDHYTTDLETLDFNVSGSAFELPGGDFGWAAGIGYIGEKYKYAPDSGKSQDAVTGNTGAGTEGSLYNMNLYAEIYAPLFDNGEQALSMTAGVRYDDYNAFDEETTWQLGIEANALADLKFRATAGTVFRAPTLSDLYGGLVDDFPTYVDPCTATPLPAGCARPGVQTDSQVPAKAGGNENLTPETGDTMTFGVVWTPQLFGGDLSLTVDYWDTQIEDGISSLGVQFILDDCYLNQNQQACDLVTRRPDYSVQQVIDTQLNVAEQGANGIDTEARYTIDTDLGQFRGTFLWSHLNERTKKAYAGAEEQDLSGRYTDPTAEDGGAYAEDKINYSLSWMWNGLTVSYLGEYISELDADTFCNCDSDGDPSNNKADGSYIQDVDAVLYHDLVANYTFDFGLGITAGVTNITDEEPPYIEIGFNATTDPSTYRLFGRGYYLRLTQTF